MQADIRGTGRRCFLSPITAHVKKTYHFYILHSPFPFPMTTTPAAATISMGNHPLLKCNHCIYGTKRFSDLSRHHDNIHGVSFSAPLRPIRRLLRDDKVLERARKTREKSEFRSRAKLALEEKQQEATNKRI
jgi:hypothetical protein